MEELSIREVKWNKMDEQVTQIINNPNDVIRLNIVGKKFATKTETILSVKDTILYQLILSKILTKIFH